MSLRAHLAGIEPWEPEESVGKLWHALASRLDAPAHHPDAAVDLADLAGRIAVIHRGLGGAAATEIRATGDVALAHRLGWRRGLGTEAEALPVASLGAGTLRLPQTLAVFPTRAANAALYRWLAGIAAQAGAVPAPPDDPLGADLAWLAGARIMRAALAQAAPGLARLHDDLAPVLLAQRPRPSLPPVEAALEALIRADLGDPAPRSPASEALAATDPAAAKAPPGYRPARPVPLWPRLHAGATANADGVETRDTDGPPEESGIERVMPARRRQADQARRRDSLILHKFEALLSWANFMNLNRRVEDDDLDDAKKAAADQDELHLGQIGKAPATRLKIHLDLSPQDADREAVSGAHTYPEWDARAGVYLPAHVRVLAAPAAEGTGMVAADDPRARRRIAAVRRQFEALRPGRVVTTGHRDGEDLDDDLMVRAQAELRASGQGSDRVWRQARPVARDLAVSILLDVSRSTESAVWGRAVIDLEREALAALAWGLDACGDVFAIQAFSSLRRDRVFVHDCKGFGEPMSAAIEARIAALRPQFYTRLGAGIRHAAAGLATQGKRRRLLLVITDGKPNDLDHYEGRHGIEDSAMAVREARRAGHAVFGVTIDRTAKAWFPRLFGRGGHALLPDPDRLTTALPAIYRQLVGA